METIDVMVVGAGIIGLSVAREMALAGRDVIVVEREKMPGSIITARNSGVIHAGIYYKPGSLKAKLCVEGKKRLYRYVSERNIPHRRCTKLIVAAHDRETERLEAIKERAHQNGTEDLYFLTAQEASRLEPALSCHAALCSPSTGIVDVHDLMAAVITDIESCGGLVALNNTLQSAAAEDRFLQVRMTDGSRFKVKTLVNAAGLEAPGLADRIKGLAPETIPQQYLAKGNYFSLQGKAPFSRLIYPVPENGGLGIHFTLNTNGEGLFGPDVEWLAGPGDISYDVNPKRAERFYDAIARYWPGIQGRTLIPAYAGIRPKLSRPGEEAADFLIQTEDQHGIPGLVNLYGIESPGLTASMAIAELIRENFS